MFRVRTNRGGGLYADGFGIRTIFKGLEQGDGASFFEHVDDNVDWIVEGTHALAGHYKSKSAELLDAGYLPSEPLLLSSTRLENIGSRDR